MEIRLETCSYYATDPEKCMTNVIIPHYEFFISRTIVDFSSQDDYKFRKMESMGSGLQGMARLQLTHVSFLDSIYDPFGSVTDVLDFLNLQKF